MEKYIFVTGGVVSGLGKGITAASLGRLLKSRGYKVTMQKFDPYLNVDPGTMSPTQHGEVFVTDDGTETDLDLGHYERFIDESLDKGSNVTTGKVYATVLEKERHGDYLGGTVQVIPHVTNEIKSRFHRSNKDDETSITIIEIGGTIGDIESQPFFESIRQFKAEVGAENVCVLIVSLIPWLSASQELKSKPTQMAVKTLQSMGIQPDIVVCRSEHHIDSHIIDKLSLFCNVPKSHVLPNYDCETVYELPLMLEDEKFAQAVCDTLHIPCTEPDLNVWRNLVQTIKTSNEVIKISLVGKYTELHDAYISVNEALKAAGWFYNKKVEIDWVESTELNEDNIEERLKYTRGILVPGGFGERGIPGMILAIKYARENKIPFLGLCLGMQTAVIEFARDVLGYEDANSAEFDPNSKHTVIDLMPEQKNIKDMGATMRLGSYPCVLKEGSKPFELYGCKNITERHRHRYEFNNDYREDCISHGLELVGTSPDNRIVEMIELKDHPFFVATQAHPEFKSRPDKPHPLFKGFIKAAIDLNK